MYRPGTTVGETVMTSSKVFLGQDSSGGLTWARYRDREGDQSPQGKPLATMSDAVRAAVVRKARKASGAGDPLTDELARLVGEVFLVQGWLNQAYGALKDTVGLTGIETMTLYAVVNSSKPVTVPQLGRKLGHARQVIQRAANTLVSRGFLETRANPAHKRAALLVPTKAGREIKLGFDAGGRAITQTLADDLDLDTVAAAFRGLRALRAAVERRANEDAVAKKAK
jgi:DNA-binding MarR family transcriptional regulator